MAKNSNVATVIIGNNKYEIESDTIVNITLENGGSFNELRVTGTNRMGNCIRCVSKNDGIVEVPLNKIKTIKDAVNTGDMSGVIETVRR